MSTNSNQYDPYEDFDDSDDGQPYSTLTPPDRLYDAAGREYELWTDAFTDSVPTITSDGLLIYVEEDNQRAVFVDPDEVDYYTAWRKS